MTDSALYWLANYDFDGFRHDACKHIPECYWRMLGQKLAERFPDRHIWMIGETYGSPELINSYVKTGMLNAQFDFNVYFTATRALCNDGTMQNLNNTILTSLSTYGSHHTMGNISLLAYYLDSLSVQPVMLTDYGFFVPASGSRTFGSFARQQVSIFNVSSRSIVSDGLRWPSYAYSALWQGMLNEAEADTFTLRADGTYIVYRTYEPK